MDVAEFKALTDAMFAPICGWATQSDIEEIVREQLDIEIGDSCLDVEVIDVVVSGSRCRGAERPDSDIDVVVYYDGTVREDYLFSILNSDESRCYVDGVPVDINPIRRDWDGRLESYLNGVEDYLAKKASGI